MSVFIAQIEGIANSVFTVFIQLPSPLLRPPSAGASNDVTSPVLVSSSVKE